MRENELLIANYELTHPRSDEVIGDGSKDDWKFSSHDNSMVFKTSRFSIGTTLDSSKSPPTLSSSVVVTTTVSWATSPDKTTSSKFSARISGF